MTRHPRPSDAASARTPRAPRVRRLVPALLLGCAGAGAAADLPPAWSVAPERVLDFQTYTEGPVFSGDGALFVSEQYTGRVTRIGADGARTTFLERPNANGHAILDDGTHVLMARPDVLWVDPAGEIVHALPAGAGAPFAFPNDLVPDGRGGFYFTDSGSRTEPTGALHHVDAERRARRLATGLAFPNGLVLDGDRLYVAQSRANDVLAFDVAADGSVSNRRVLITLPEEGLDQAKNAPDGMCARDGRLFVAHNGMDRVRVVSADGELLASYRAGLLAVSNCAFGPDGTLYLTGSTGHELDPGAVVRLDLGLGPLP